MKDALKIALGIFIGVLAVLAFVLCGFVALGWWTVDVLSSEFAVSVTDPPTILPTPLPSTPTPVAAISEGEWAQWGGLRLSVTSHETNQTCPGGGGQPAAGAKFVVAHLAAHNRSADVIAMPSLQFYLNGRSSGLGTSGDCRYNAEAFGNACWQSSGQLYPDVICVGWVLFEVPAEMPLEGTIIRLEEVKPEPIHISEWRLGGD